MTEEEKKKESEVWQRDYRAERKAEWEKIRALGWKARLGYFWDYYKFVLVIIFALIIAVSIIRTMIIGTMTDVIFSLAVVNSDSAFSDTSLLEKDFATYLGGLDKHEEIHIDSSMNIVENPMTQADMMGEMKLTVYTASGSLDACLIPEKLIPRLQPSGIFLDLNTLLSDEEKEKWSDDLIYAPEPVEYEEMLIDETEGSDRTGGQETEMASSKTQGDEDKGPEGIYGVRVDGDGILTDYISYSQSPVCLCIVASSVHEDTDLEFLRFLKGEDPGQLEEAST